MKYIIAIVLVFCIVCVTLWLRLTKTRSKGFIDDKIDLSPFKNGGKIVCTDSNGKPWEGYLSAPESTMGVYQDSHEIDLKQCKLTGPHIVSIREWCTVNKDFNPNK